MKRPMLGVAIVGSAALLGGCPIYSTQSDYPSCGSDGQCFDCPSGSTPSDNTCIPWQCGSSSDCPAGYACSANSCVAAPDASDCSAGCASGYICKLAGGQTQCVPASSLGSDAGNGAGNDAEPARDAASIVDSTRPDGNSIATPDASMSASDAPYAPDVLEETTVVDSFVTSDAFPSSDASAVSDASIVSSDASVVADTSDASPASSASDGSIEGVCNANSDCGGGGAKCIDGHCTPQSRLCSDTTQCVTAGESCVDGVCEPHCGVSVPCPGGYACDFSRGVCNVNPEPCNGSGTSTCQGGSACVEGHCVPPCAGDDAGGGACPSGQLCVNGGCMPDEAAQFDCSNDGQSGPLATACATTAICLHHDCYAGCNPDAGAAACADPTALCKPVVVTAGTYDVCATSSNLGSDCDPATGKYCSGGVCLDGYCR